MRKTYTAVKLDTPHAISGEHRVWIPMLKVRPARGHAVMRAPMLAIVDSGSPYTLFRADVAHAIGIRDITDGKPAQLGGVKAGVEDTFYFHNIKLYIETEWIVDVTAGFSPHLSVAGLLGRNGFFDHFFVTFDHATTPPVLEVTKIDRLQ